MNKSKSGCSLGPMVYLLLIFALIVLVEQLFFMPSGHNEFRVTRVIDGDTFVASDGRGEEIRVRLIGVNAPETRGRDRDSGGGAAKEFLTDLIDGKRVTLRYDVEREDRFGRHLAYVYLRDGTFVNDELVRMGYATAATHPPNVRHSEMFYRSEAEARSFNRGLWGN